MHMGKFTITTLVLLAAPAAWAGGGSTATVSHTGESVADEGTGKVDTLWVLDVDLAELHERVLAELGEDAAAPIPTEGWATAYIVEDGATSDTYLDVPGEKDLFAQVRHDGVVTVAEWDGASTGTDLVLHFDEEDLALLESEPAPLALEFDPLDVELAAAYVETLYGASSGLDPFADEPPAGDESSTYMSGSPSGECARMANEWPDECQSEEIAGSCCDGEKELAAEECGDRNKAERESAGFWGGVKIVVGMLTGNANSTVNGGETLSGAGSSGQDCGRYADGVWADCMRITSTLVSEPESCP